MSICRAQGSRVVCGEGTGLHARLVAGDADSQCEVLALWCCAKTVGLDAHPACTLASKAAAQ